LGDLFGGQLDDGSTQVNALGLAVLVVVIRCTGR
jgi:hypothetical protein